MKKLSCRYTSLSWSAFPSSATNGGSVILSDPVAVPVADSFEMAIKSGAGTCTWTQLTKKLAFTGKKCVVTVTAKKAGYEDLIKEFSVDPSLLAITVTKGAYGTVLADGVAVAAPTLTLDPTDATKAYTSTTPHICTVDPNTGAVTGKQAGNCGIELTLSKAGHNNNIQPYTVVVQGIFASIVWDAFPSSAVQGTPTAALSSPTSSPPADTYAITKKSGDCAWDDATDILSFSGITPCILTVTAEKTGYQSKAKDFSVTAVGVISATAGSYGDAIYLEEAATTSPLTGLDPTDADTAYVSADEAICTVDEDTGAITGVKEGSCRVTLTLSKAGYNGKTIEYVTPVTPLYLNAFKGKNIFKGLVLGKYTKPVFADVDGDGDRDLVVGLENGTLKYYRKNPSGSPIPFSEQTGTDNPFNGFDVGNYAIPTFADVDGDNDNDLVVGESTGTLKYFLNESANGIITFTAKTAASDNPFSSIDVGNSSAPTFADVDGDGNLDLVVGESTGTLKYFLNESTTESVIFTEKTSTENPFNNIDIGGYSVPTFADVDGDNDLDLIVGNSTGALKFFLNESITETITFTPKTSTENPFNSLGTTGSYAAPTFADINGDNKIDLVIGGTFGTLKSFLNESTQSETVFTRQTENINPFNGINFGITYITPTFADINGDNKQDMVIGGYDGTLKYFLNESTEETIAFTPKTSTHNPFNGFDVGAKSVPIFADVDGDDDLDLVVGESKGTLKYFLNESVGNTITFTPKTGASDNPFNGFDVGLLSTPVFTDVDGDNKIDLIIGESGGSLKFYLNESTTETVTFTPKTGASDNPFNGFSVRSDAAPAFGDIDGDGDLDLVVGSWLGTLNYYLNESTNSTVVFTPKTGGNNPFNGFDVEINTYPTSTDIDGDGDLDLVVGSSGTAVLTIINHLGTWIPFR